MLKEPKRIIAEEPRAPDYSNEEIKEKIDCKSSPIYIKILGGLMDIFAGTQKA